MKSEEYIRLRKMFLFGIVVSLVTIWKSILKWIGISILALILAALVFICIVRVVTCFSNRIDAPNGVDEGIYVTLGGQEQYLLIRGED